MSSAVPPEIDVRGPRFAAWVTAVVLAVAVVQGSGTIVAVQAVVFAVGAFAGLRYAPYGVLFRLLVAPRLGARAGAGGAAALRAARRPDVRRRGRRRLPARRSRARRRRHRCGAGGGPAQRGHRLLPGL